MSTNSPSITKLKQCRHGKMLFLRTDKFIGASLDRYGEYCEAEAELFAQILSPGQLVIEAGANIGAHTIHLAGLVGDNGQVLAFEPQPLIFQLLCANVALNEAFNVRTYNVACGVVPGRLKVPRVDYRADGGNFGGVVLTSKGPGHDVDVLALDSFSLRSLRLLKIDVEGMETAVLEGGRRQIARHRPVIYVENDRRDQSADLIAMIQSFGYDLYWHIAYLFNRANHAEVAENIFGGTASINMLCLPAEQANSVQGFHPIKSPLDWWEDLPS